MSTIGGRRLDFDQPSTMGGERVAPDVVDGLGVLHVPVKPKEDEAERQLTIERVAGERTLERLAYVKNQPLVAVTLADITHAVPNPAMTLADAHAVIEDCGG